MEVWIWFMCHRLPTLGLKQLLQFCSLICGWYIEWADHLRLNGSARPCSRTCCWVRGSGLVRLNPTWCSRSFSLWLQLLQVAASVSPNMYLLFKPLISSGLSISFWPKQVTGQSPDGSEREVNFSSWQKEGQSHTVTVIFVNNLLQILWSNKGLTSQLNFCNFFPYHEIT